MIKIPSHWTAEQADFIHTFLLDLIDDIWSIYEDELIEICLQKMQPQLSQPDSNDQSDDHWDNNIPF